MSCWAWRASAASFEWFCSTLVLLSAAVVSSPPANSSTSVPGHLACFREARAAACHHWMCSRPSLAQRWEEICSYHSSMASLLLWHSHVSPEWSACLAWEHSPVPGALGLPWHSCGKLWAVYFLFLSSFTILMCHLVLGFFVVVVAVFTCNFLIYYFIPFAIGFKTSNQV